MRLTETSFARARLAALLPARVGQAFLKRRSDPTMGEEMRSCLNALLYNTGTASRKFMLVLATNRPGDLDLAVSDRVDEQLRFDLPGPEERGRLLQ